MSGEKLSFQCMSISTSFAYQCNIVKNAALQRNAMSIEKVCTYSCTPAECYVSETTYRSAGADMSVHHVAINILLRWSKKVLVC